LPDPVSPAALHVIAIVVPSADYADSLNNRRNLWIMRGAGMS